MNMILALRTDNPETELYLLRDDGEITRQKFWNAERELARDLLAEIEKLVDGTFTKIDKIIVYEGPGSFTGLRIGISVANALSYAFHAPIIGTTGERWLADGVTKLRDNLAMNQNEILPKNEKTTSENGVTFATKAELERSLKLAIVTPNYGAAAHITKPKK